MLNLPTIADLQAAAESETRPNLRALLADRLSDTVKCGLQELTHVVVVEEGDSEADIVEAIGFSPLETRIDNTRNELDADWVERHAGWWELLYTVGNSGHACIVIVEDADDVPLARLCRRKGPSR